MLRRANSMNARVCLVLGKDEVAQGIIQVKDLQGHSQDNVARNAVATHVTQLLAEPLGAPS
jgi:histidyl-tRNA synthetase